MSNILTSEASGVATVKLNRPDSLNAFTPEMLSELLEAITAAEANSVIVIEGQGRAFSAGVDLKVLQGIEPNAGRIGDVFDKVAEDLTRKIRHNRLPVIAKVHGACFTGALEIALSCDFIVAEVNTKFGDTHAKWGLRPTWGMAQNLARAVGVRKARELSYSAQVFSGADALNWGLANHVAEGLSDLDQIVDKLATQIVEGSGPAVSAYKILYRLHEEQRALEDSLQREIEMQFPDITDTKQRLGDFGK